MKAVDLFSGCGGLSLGLQKAGIDVLLAMDSWMPAVETYNANFAHECLAIDLGSEQSAIDKIRPLNVDLIAGGPPCQEFSHAGKRQEGDRANLTKSFAMVIDAVRPKYFIMENVDRVRHSEAYANARGIYKKAGYGLTERVLDASFYKVPQKRKRFFCIGILGEGDSLLHASLDPLTNKRMTVKDYFKSKIDIEGYYRHPRNYSRRAIYSVHEPAPTMRGVNRPVPAGYPGHPGDAIPLSKSIRPLTTSERAAIQTFPKRFKFIGPKTHVEQMVGNAVPVNLAKFIGKRLLEYDSGELEISGVGSRPVGLFA